MWRTEGESKNLSVAQSPLGAMRTMHAELAVVQIDAYSLGSIGLGSGFRV